MRGKQISETHSTVRLQNGGYSVARSQSAAGVARPPRARSKSPRRSLSPPADRDWRYTGAAGARRLYQPIGISHFVGLIGPWTSKIQRA